MECHSERAPGQLVQWNHLDQSQSKLEDLHDGNSAESKIQFPVIIDVM